MRHNRSILQGMLLRMSFIAVFSGAVCAQEKSKVELWQEHRSQIVNDPDLVAYYDFQEGSGNLLKNVGRSNPELNGVIHGATWNTGRWPGKKALRFDGNAYVEIPHSPSLYMLDTATGGTGELTIEVSLCANSTAESGIVDKYSEGWGKDAPYALWITSGQFMGFVGDGNTGQGVRDPVALAKDTWVQVVFTVDAEYITLYKNALLISQVERTLPAVDNGKSLLIGTMVPGKFHYKGLIDEIAIYKRSLKEKEINRHFKTRPVVTFQIP